MTIETQWDDCATQLKELFEFDATFTPSVGDPVSCKVRLDLAVDMQPGGYEALAFVQGKIIEYSLDEVGKEADIDETFTIDSIVYTVKTVLENDGRFVRVAVT